MMASAGGARSVSATTIAPRIRERAAVSARSLTTPISDYDRFAAYCAAEFSRHPKDAALRYFDNRFFNRRADNQTGHLRQAFYAASEFFKRHRTYRTITTKQVSDGRLRVNDWPALRAWRQFVSQYRNIALPDEASMATVHRILSKPLGGVVSGGGGASPSFKVVIPLVARYLLAGGTVRVPAQPLGADQWDDSTELEGSYSRRSRFETSRIIRDSRKSVALKELHEHRCQVCG